MRNHLTLYVNVTAEDFYNWLVIYLQDDGPLETFYNTMFPDGGFIWTPVETMHDPADEPNWWRYAVGLTEDWQGKTIIDAEDGALAFCFTQSRANPYNPRAEVIFDWHELFPGTTWELLTQLANAYPEAQPTIDSWKKTPEGQEAGEAAAICRWWEEYVSKPYYTLLRHTDMADPNLTDSEFQAQYFQTEEGAQIVGAAKKAMRLLPIERQEWLFKMLDLGQYHYDIGHYRYSETLEERLKAKAQAVESLQRVERWQQEVSESPEIMPNFEQWAREEGYIPSTAEVSAPAGDVMTPKTEETVSPLAVQVGKKRGRKVRLKQWEEKFKLLEELENNSQEQGISLFIAVRDYNERHTQNPQPYSTIQGWIKKRGELRKINE